MHVDPPPPVAVPVLVLTDGGPVLVPSSNPADRGLTVDRRTGSGRGRAAAPA